mgnify:CR=1 FL=1|jgi:hypothetical protein
MGDSINPQPGSFRSPTGLHEPMAYDRAGSQEQGKGLTLKDQTRNQNDQAPGHTDLGSRWCPEEMEIFFNCKLKHAFHKTFDH